MLSLLPGNSESRIVEGDRPKAEDAILAKNFREVVFSTRLKQGKKQKGLIVTPEFQILAEKRQKALWRM
jgi:hypothetical protein